MDPNEEDLRLLYALRQVKPKVVRDIVGTSYIHMTSIPPEVLTAINALPSDYFVAGNEEYQCLDRSDWLRCREQLLSELMKRMTRRSLELSLQGPKPEDLAHAPHLALWYPIRHPESGGAILVGVQTGYSSLDGHLINTSRLCGICTEGEWARTATRWYKLGELAKPTDLRNLSRKNAINFRRLGLTLSEVQQDIATDRVSAEMSGV